MVKSKIKAKQLYTSGFCFGHVIQKIKKYLQAEPSSVYMICCGISHTCINDCNDQPVRCIICISLHKVNKYWCRVIGYSKGIDKICVYMVAKYANCYNNHSASFSQCLL